MNFYQEISPYIEYLNSIRKLENYFSFDMVFPTKWSLPKSLVNEDQVVGFKTQDENLKGISFVSEINEEKVTLTLDKISKLIKYNKEKELKEKLFRQTIDELKKTFEKNDLEKLQNLYFGFSSEMDDTSNLEDYDTGEQDIELA